MMFKITCKAYHIVARNQLNERLREIEARYFRGENGFASALEIEAQALVIENGIINVWTEYDRTQVPDISVCADDVFAIELIKEEE